MTWYILNVPAIFCEWATRENCRYFLWENSGCSHQLPNGDIVVTWLGTLWVYWQCPGLGHCREIGLENSEHTCSVLGRYMVGTLSISLQCTCSVPVRYTTPCPQCAPSQQSPWMEERFRALRNLPRTYLRRAWQNDPMVWYPAGVSRWQVSVSHRQDRSSISHDEIDRLQIKH